MDLLETSRGMILIYPPSSAKCCILVATLGEYNGLNPNFVGYDFQLKELGLITNSNDDSLDLQTKPNSLKDTETPPRVYLGAPRSQAIL